MKVLTPYPDDERQRNVPAVINPLDQQLMIPDNRQQHDPINTWPTLVQAMNLTVERLQIRRSFYEQELAAGKEYAQIMLQLLDEVVNRLTVYVQFGSDEVSVRYWLHQSTMF